MNFLKGNGSGNTDQAQSATTETQSGGGGLMGKLNSAVGGGQAGEKNEGPLFRELVDVGYSDLTLSLS